MKFYKTLKWIVFIFIFITPLSTLFSQSSTISNPIIYEENVALIPKIIVTFDNDIDSSSIKEAFSYCESDTLAEVYEQSFLVIPSIVGNMNRDKWKWFARRGQYKLEDNKTLSLTLDLPLEPNSEYIIIVSNLKVVTENNDTIPIYQNSTTFTTVSLVHEVIQNSLSIYPFVRCDDTLCFTFTRDLPFTTTPLGDIVEINILDSTSYSSSTITRYYSNVDADSWLDVSNNSKIMIKPSNNFDPGAQYRLKINTSYINGDKNSDKIYEFTVKDKYSISILVDVESSTLTKPENVTWPPEGTTYHSIGSEIPIYTQKVVGNLVFNKWISNNSQYNNLQSPLIKVNLSCEDVSDIWLTAIYIEYDSISCAINNNDSLTIKVYDSGYNYLGGSGTYTIQKDDHILVQTYGINDNNHFSNWVSDEQIINSDNQENKMKSKKDNLQFIAFNPSMAVIKVCNSGRDINMDPISNADQAPKYKLTFRGDIDFDVLQAQNIEWEVDYFSTKNLSLAIEMGLIQIFVNNVPVEQSEIELPNNDPVIVKLTINPNFPRCPTGAGFNFEGYMNKSGIYEFPIEENNFPTELIFSVIPSDDIYFVVRPWHGTPPKVNVTTEWNPSINPNRVIGKDFFILAQILSGNCTLGYQLLRDENGMDVDGLFCGVNVALYPIEMGSVKFAQWTAETTYYHQDPGEHADEIYDKPTTIIIMGSDEKAKAKLLSTLSIEKIQFEIDINKDYPSFDRDQAHPTTDHYIRTGANPAIVNFTILYDDLLQQYGKDIGKKIVRDIESWDYTNNTETGYGAQIKFKLSDDAFVINNLYNNVWIEETAYKDADGLGVQGRVDGLGTKKIVFDASNSSIFIDPMTQEKFFVFKLPGNVSDPNKVLPKGQTFLLVFSKNLDPSGNMKDDVYIQCQMQLPGVVSRITNCKADRTDWWPWSDPEFVFPWAALVLGPTTSSIRNNEPLVYTEQYEFQYNYPDYSPWYIEGEHHKVKNLSPSIKMYETSQMFIEDNLVEMFGLFDHDGKACNKSGKMKELISGVVTNLKPAYNDWAKSSYDLANALKGVEANPFKDPFDKLKDDITEFTKNYGWVPIVGGGIYSILDSAGKAAVKNLIPSLSEIIKFCGDYLIDPFFAGCEALFGAAAGAIVAWAVIIIVIAIVLYYIIDWLYNMFGECDLLARYLSCNSWLNGRFGSEPKSIKQKIIESHMGGTETHEIKLKKLEVQNSTVFYK